MLYKKIIKRILDFWIALSALILLLPALLLIALLILFDMGSPVIFKQVRPGKNCKLFAMYKFRTMRAAQELSTGKKITDERRLQLISEKGEASVTSDDQRLTGLGRLLRKLSLDELPELVNILKGDMSLVGPRPLASIYVDYYNDTERRRHEVLPGLTGLAQVNGRNAISWEKRFAYDIEYVDHVSFSMDIRILCSTVAVVLKHKDVAQGEERPEAFHLVRQKELANQPTATADK